MIPDQHVEALAIRNRIGVDSTATMDAFRTICEALESGKPVPPPLATFLTSALRRTLEARSADRVQTLMYELALTAPPKTGAPIKQVDPVALNWLICRELKNDRSISDASLLATVGKSFKISRNTAQKYVPGATLIPKMLYDNQIECLIPLKRGAYGNSATDTDETETSVRGRLS